MGLKATELCRRFENLPDESERDYELTLTKMVNRSEVDEAGLKELLRNFREKKERYTPEQREQKEKIAYAAFFCLNILYRHTLEPIKFRAIIQENRDWCSQHKTFQFVVLLHSIHIPEDLDGHEDEFLSVLYNFAQTYQKNAGYAHSFADLYAIVCESNFSRQEYYRHKWEKKAVSEIKRAIFLDPDYALYYSTQGRIMLISGDYAAADELFKKAMLKEDSSRKDGYGIRISQYQSYKSQARAMLASARVQEQIDALKAANISNIEVLGFFASVVAFILGSLSLAQGQTAANAAGLIIVLMGALLVVYTMFSLLLHFNTTQNTKNKRFYLANLVVTLFGIVLIAGGIAVCFKT